MSRLTLESLLAQKQELPPLAAVIKQLRQRHPWIQQEQHRYRSPRGFQPWANHLAYAALMEAGLETMDAIADSVGAWAATTCRWVRIHKRGGATSGMAGPGTTSTAATSAPPSVGDGAGRKAPRAGL